MGAIKQDFGNQYMYILFVGGGEVISISPLLFVIVPRIACHAIHERSIKAAVMDV